jgi:hypothetical protein
MAADEAAPRPVLALVADASAVRFTVRRRRLPPFVGPNRESPRRRVRLAIRIPLSGHSPREGSTLRTAAKAWILHFVQNDKPGVPPSVRFAIRTPSAGHSVRDSLRVASAVRCGRVGQRSGGVASRAKGAFRRSFVSRRPIRTDARAALRLPFVARANNHLSPVILSTVKDPRFERPPKRGFFTSFRMTTRSSSVGSFRHSHPVGRPFGP